MSIQAELLAYVEREHSDQLLTPPQLTQDALTLVLRNGAVLSVRFAAADAYSMHWRTSPHAEAHALGIDTAPVHRGLATWPNHLHLADGSVTADPLTRIGEAPESNLSRVLLALAQDPLLGGGPA
ncbi:MAG TPA: hypothetical protein PKN82_08785 [Thauera sp.]|nr:hypothetical protein [Thauera sp.]HNS92758.1 hypothetical protein [Thauera sp.]